MAINYRGIIRKLMPRAIASGILPTHYLAMCQLSYGQAYKKTIFLADWREFAGIERKRGKLQSIGKRKRITEATSERTEYEQHKKFNHNYKITGYDTILQKDVTTYVTVASDDRLTMEQADAMAQFLADKYKVDIEIAEMIRDGVTVK